MGISRKTWWLFAAAAVVALALVVPAFATAGDSGYMQWDSMAGANGTSPHGGYSTTTQKCVVCHAVHAADLYGQLLLRGSVAGACIYCHVGGGGGYTEVYEGNDANYSGPDPSYDHNNAHNAWEGAGGPGVQCNSCHQVHGATLMMTANDQLRVKLLKVDDSGGWPYDTAVTVAPSNADSKELALSKWCTTCHGSSISAPQHNYYNVPTNEADPSSYMKTAHVMTTETAVFDSEGASINNKVAWEGSNFCSSCHASQYGTAAWPHYTTGVRFLTSAGSIASATPVAATDSQQDGICLRCHRSGVGSGVGIDF